MDRYEETFNTWNKVSKLYEEKFMHLDLYDDTYALFCSRLKKEDATILEIGCGPGNITKYLREKMPKLSILGIDIAPNMIALAEKNNPTAVFKVMDTRDISSLDTKYDGLMIGFCLPYLSEEDVAKLIKDAATLLLSGGVIYISFVEGIPEQSGYAESGTGDRTYFYYHDLHRLSELLTENDFIINNILHKSFTRSNGITEIHNIVLAEKK